MQTLLTISETICFFIILSFIISLVISKNKTATEKWLLALLVSFLIFHITYWPSVKEIPALFWICFPIAVSLPFVFLVFSWLYFDIKQPKRKVWIPAISIVYLVNFTCFFIPFFSDVNWISNLAYGMSILVLIIPSILAIVGLKSDLLEERRRTRFFLIIENSIFGLIVIFTFAFYNPLALPEIVIILSLIGTTLLILTMFEIKISLYSVRKKAKDANTEIEVENKKEVDAVFEKIKYQIEEEKIYRLESITITSLSTLISEKEYIVRKSIRAHFDFANFNQLINHYRVNEAKELLLKNELSNKEIAFHIGYSNPSTFNRSFKNIVGSSPSEFKNNQ